MIAGPLIGNPRYTSIDVTYITATTISIIGGPFGGLGQSVGRPSALGSLTSNGYFLMELRVGRREASSKWPSVKLVHC